MSTLHRRGWQLPTVLLLLVVGCSTHPEPEPVAPTPSPGAALVCGVDPADVERATGYVPDQSTNSLVAANGQGAGACTAFSDDSDGAVLWVRFHRLDDPEAIAVRQRMSGDLDITPSLIYDPRVVDGAVWGADDVPGPQRGVSANAEVFWGETHISVFISPAAANRNGADDLLNLAYQVIDTYELERPEP
jgi:hypothetical protein